MINARVEFLNHIGNKKVKCALITYMCKKEAFVLKTKHSKKEFEAFLKSLDFEYNNGYGTQELFGTIWYQNGSWATRWEYYGSEGWEDQEVPKIPDDVKIS